MSELCIDQETTRNGRLGRRRVQYGDDRDFKSKNLIAERNRRQKLSDRLLTLRALVPKITNMNKATILEDALTYIQELKKEVDNLSEQLFEMDAIFMTAELEDKTSDDHEITDVKEEIMEEVQVSNVDEHKLWIKISLEKKKGKFTRLLEGMNCLGFELTDTSVTSSKATIIVCSCVKSTCGDIPAAEQTKELLLEIIGSI